MGEEFELVALANGVFSLRSVHNGQTFHPVVGPAAEARAVHVAGTRLLERANACPAAGFTIWDVGLGAAANATAAIDTLALSYQGAGAVRLLSFDRTLDALDFALANAAVLGYPLAYLEPLQALRRARVCAVALPHAPAGLSWQLYLADFPALLAGAEPLPPPHAIFYDPYSPAVNREMWTLELFTALRARLRPEAPCLLTTYTRSTARAGDAFAGWVPCRRRPVDGRERPNHRGGQRSRAAGAATGSRLAGKQGLRFDQRGAAAIRRHLSGTGAHQRERLCPVAGAPAVFFSWRRRHVIQRHAPGEPVAAVYDRRIRNCRSR